VTDSPAPSTQHPAWEVRDLLLSGNRFQFSVQRGTNTNGDLETGAICWDYGLACLIEAALNLRDGTVE
jgi:hypothetical protein